MMVRLPSITCFFSWWERTPQGKEDDDDDDDDFVVVCTYVKGEWELQLKDIYVWLRPTMGTSPTDIETDALLRKPVAACKLCRPCIGLTLKSSAILAKASVTLTSRRSPTLANLLRLALLDKSGCQTLATDNPSSARPS